MVFLGLVNYAANRFKPQLATLTAPLRELLKKDTEYKWTNDHEVAFQKLKTCLLDVIKLSFFNKSDRTMLYADAGPVAWGAVLVQVKENGKSMVVSCASQGFNEVEKKYSQTEKEAAALVKAVRKFEFFLRGKDFDLVTDHKALEFMFQPTAKTSARVSRWLMTIQDFRFSVKYKPGSEQIADAFSRICANPEVMNYEDDSDEYVLNMVINQEIPAVTIKELSEASSVDHEFKLVREALNSDE